MANHIDWKIQKKGSMGISIALSTGTTRMIQILITVIQALDQGKQNMPTELMEKKFTIDSTKSYGVERFNLNQLIQAFK